VGPRFEQAAVGFTDAAGDPLGRIQDFILTAAHATAIVIIMKNKEVKHENPN
jgi:hypothetical protein